MPKTLSFNDNTSDDKATEERLDSSKQFFKYWIWLLGPYHCDVWAKEQKWWCCLFACVTMIAVHTQAVLKLDIYFRLNEIMHIIAQRGTSKTITSSNETNFVRAEKNLSITLRHRPQKRLLNLWFTKESNENSTHPQYLTLDGMETDCQKLQEIKFSSVGEQISHCGRSFNYEVPFRQILNSRPLVPVSLDIN